MESEEYVGKRALIGISYCEADGSLIERKQYHGTITGVDERGMLILERADGKGELTIPAQLEPAKASKYTLAGTGEVVVDPDYTGVWTVTSHPPPEAPDED